MLSARSLPVAICALLVAGAPGAAQAQLTSVLTAAGGPESAGGHTTALFQLGLRADLLLLRNRDRDMGIGPFLGVAEDRFRVGSVQGGVDWLVPAWLDIPFVFSAGAFSNFGEGGGHPGAVGAVHWGSRSRNLEGTYDLSLGIFVEGRHAADGVDSVVGGAEIDLSLLAYPIIALWSAAH